MSLSRALVPVDKKSAAYRAVQAMSKKDSSIDPDDPMQLDLYRSLRTSFGRVSATTFKRWLEARDDDTMGTSFRISVWCVPKRNFPHGLPSDIAEHEVTEEELDYAKRNGGCTDNADLSQFYLVDQCVPRKLLGKSVATVDFTKKNLKDSL